MAVPPVVLLIPKFLVIKQLGIYNTFVGLIIPLLADAAGVFIMKGFFETIPPSVEEAARIDGAGTIRIWWSVVLPMAVPALITITILSFQASWNELSHFIVASQDPSLVTLTKGVAQLASGALSAGTQYPLKLAAAAIMTIPVAVLFFVFQRRIMNVERRGGEGVAGVEGSGGSAEHLLGVQQDRSVDHPSVAAEHAVLGRGLVEHPARPGDLGLRRPVGGPDHLDLRGVDARRRREPARRGIGRLGREPVEVVDVEVHRVDRRLAVRAGGEQHGGPRVHGDVAVRPRRAHGSTCRRATRRGPRRPT